MTLGGGNLLGPGVLLSRANLWRNHGPPDFSPDPH